MKPAGVILAGGRSSRMDGRDKAFAALRDRPLLAHVVTSLRPQVEALLINSNGDPARFAAFGLPVLPDGMSGRLGPLAGLLTGMRWAQRDHQDATHLLSAPCDIPGLPKDIGTRLANALQGSGADVAVACDEDGLQPTIALWPVSLAEKLEEDLARGVRGMQAWLGTFRVAPVRCHGLANINTPDDLRMAGEGKSIPPGQALDAPIPAE